MAQPTPGNHPIKTPGPGVYGFVATALGASMWFWVRAFSWKFFRRRYFMTLMADSQQD
ncbi:hypothetical protein KEM54_006709 [Ascosphaera aggregata]|nr:hypothetical protein KEM54_006709 [Ascosphaera aggregata]